MQEGICYTLWAERERERNFSAEAQINEVVHVRGTVNIMASSASKVSTSSHYSLGVNGGITAVFALTDISNFLISFQSQRTACLLPSRQLMVGGSPKRGGMAEEGGEKGKGGLGHTQGEREKPTMPSTVGRRVCV